jgi:hypothetical protein
VIAAGWQRQLKRRARPGSSGGVDPEDTHKNSRHGQRRLQVHSTRWNCSHWQTCLIRMAVPSASGADWGPLFNGFCPHGTVQASESAIPPWRFKGEATGVFKE